uniref:MAM domain-containing protein n=1 Tax=Romanomermis culicivorax TaxID=13658 RepID=A0A915L868_ROMCU
GGFAFAQVDPKGQNTTFALASRPFSLAQHAVLTFAYHLTGRAGRLRLCDQSFDSCSVIDENTESTGAASSPVGWRSTDVPFLPGVHQVPNLELLIFVADKVTPNFVIGLDNIQIWDKTRSVESEC